MTREQLIQSILEHIEAARTGIEELNRGRVGMSMVVASSELAAAAARVLGQSEEEPTS